MKNIGLVPLLLLLLFEGAQAQILQHTYLDENEQGVFFEDEMRFILDSTGQLTVEDLLSDSTLLAIAPSAISFPDTIYYLWTSLKLDNQSSGFRNEFLVTFWEIDSLWTYTVSNGEVTDLQITGEGVAVWEKHPSHVKNMATVGLAPGERKMLWLRFRIRLPTTKRYLPRIFSMESAAPINKYIVTSYAWQSFYFGFMLLFSLLSLYMYRLFQDRVFLYFGGLMLSFGCYFIISSRVSDVFLVSFFPFAEFLFLKVAISGIVFCCSLFVINYLGLKQQYQRLVKMGLVWVVFMELFSHLAPLVLPYNTAAAYHNIMLLVWVVLTFVPIVLVARRGEARGKALVGSVLILVAAAGVHLLQISESNPIEGRAFNVFQLGTMIFAAVLFYDLFTRIDTIRREKERFQELDHLKSRFFANISHEFRTPLTLIKSPLSQLKDKLDEPRDRKLVGLMQRNTDRLLSLINQILDLSKLEAGKMKLAREKVNFPALLKGIVMSFESLAEQQGVRLHYASEVDELEASVDPDKVEQIFNNLLSNAFKYTQVSEEISVLLTVKEEWITVWVKDTGRGIPTDQLPHIFNRFFQAEDTQKEDTPGTGIGLTLVKELVHLHGGTISVRSVENKRTTFRLRFPLDVTPSDITADDRLTARSGNDATFVFPEKKLAVSEVDIPQVSPLDRYTDTTPLVLIVEDHEDVRYYVQQNLCTQYRILEAADGQEGIDKALEYQPDLIISDVMMPKKNGYELCQTLKNDQRTSHIPLILLTAKAAREEKLHGLEEGADDYLLKPFDTEELQLRVRNLIASRRQLRQQYTELAEGAIIDPQLSATDQAFLEKIYAILNAHLSNEQFGVDVLAAEVNMSRRHLNRKLSALTDLSANPFIRNYRLQKALLMLQKQEGNVSEVALATGFSSTAYFVKCFREKFGQTPGSL